VDINRYAYALNDPINLSDPNGHSSYSDNDGGWQPDGEGGGQYNSGYGSGYGSGTDANTEAGDPPNGGGVNTCSNCSGTGSGAGQNGMGESGDSGTIGDGSGLDAGDQLALQIGSNQFPEEPLEIPRPEWCLMQCIAFGFDEGLEAAALLQALPVKPKPGGVAGGGPSGPKTSYGSSALRKVTLNSRVPKELNKVAKSAFGTTSVGGILSKILGYAGVAGAMHSTSEVLDCTASCVEDENWSPP
jgi:hypothetical protein